MGLDVGDKTIGVAVSDSLGFIAQGVEVIRRSSDNQQGFKRLKELVQEYEVTQLVVGLPRNMNGTIGPQGEKVQQFAAKLEKMLSLPLAMWDERLSTAEAERLLIGADVSRGKRRKVIDKMAASIILQGYLDYKSMARGD